MTPEPSQNRRAVLARGLGLLASGSLLAACSSRRPRTATLPGPVWPHEKVPLPASAAPAPSAAAPSQIAQGRMVVMPRSRWTGAHPDISDTNPMVRIEHITVHHDGMPPAVLRSEADAADRLEMIRSSHVDHRGWADIGYHLIVDPQGRVWQGRPMNLQGAHVRDHNPRNLGVLVLGNFEMERPSVQATAALDTLLAHMARSHRVSLDRIHTHREWASTACPGRNLQAHMDRTRSGSGTLRAMLSRA